MKKLITISIAILMFIQIANAQNPFTIENVYNFEIGDLFQYTHEINNYGYIIDEVWQKEVIDKYYSLNSDTVFYQIHTLRWQYYHYENDTVYNDFTNIINYSNLSDIVEVQGNDGYITLVNEYCNDSLIKFKFQNNDPSQSGTTYTIHKFGIGLGKTCYDRSENGVDNYQNELMSYYDKGDSVCGTYNHIFETMDINNIKLNAINIYPNPAHNYIVITTKNKFEDKKIKILALTGKLIKCMNVEASQKNVRINIEDFQSGIYLVKIGERIEKLVVQ